VQQRCHECTSALGPVVVAAIAATSS
jgi:hypothetical protein